MAFRPRYLYVSFYNKLVCLKHHKFKNGKSNKLCWYMRLLTVDIVLLNGYKTSKLLTSGGGLDTICDSETPHRTIY